MYLTPLFFPNLLKLQRNSFLRFLEYGIKKEIHQINTFYNKKTNTSVILYPKLYQLNLPLLNCNQCLLTSNTYSCELNIPVKMKKNIISTGWVNLTKIPLMTNKCHFILNGSPKIIISQITRSPGIYYQKSNLLIKGKKHIHYADIIAEKGNWLRIEIDNKENIWMKIKKMPKIPMLLFLQALGIKGTTLIDSSQFPFSQNEDTTEALRVFSQKDAIKQIDLLCKFNSRRDLALNWNKSKINIFERFLSDKYYNLGKIGRIQINKRFRNYNQIQSLTLTPNDLLLVTNFLLKLKNRIENIDDIDNFKNKRIRMAGELLQSQLNIGLLRLSKYLKERIGNGKKIKNLNNLFSSGPINSALAEFFGINPLSQFMDEINPLAIITHKRRLSSLGFGGINRETATMTIRSIHPTLYGRVCPIETPEGKNAGLVNSFTLLANVNSEGFLQTPFFQVDQGKILYEVGINYITPYQEETNHVLSYDIMSSRIGFLPSRNLPVRIQQQLREIYSKNLELISISRIQMLSIATSLIPFLEHNDANRVLMGSNMQRQAVPLIKPECCLVGTGLESKIILDLEEGIKTYSDGIISYLSAKKIIFYSFIKKYIKLVKNPQFLNNFIINNRFNSKNILTSFPILKYNSHPLFLRKRKLIKFHKYISLFKLQRFYLSLKDYKNSNQGTCSINKIQINEGQWILRNTYLSSGLASFRNELSLGNNLFVAYISWRGYNFEDAVVLSQNLLLNHLYTSTHLEKFDVEIKKTKENIESLTPYVKNITTIQKAKLDKNGVIKVGSRVYGNDVLVGKQLLLKSTSVSPYRKLLYQILQEEFNNSKDTSIRVPKHKQGRITLIDYSYSKETSNQVNIARNLSMLRIHLMQNRLIQIGDKISGRHGNKGIISKILPILDMPYLIDGTCIDIILNPLGVPSRMNIGQVLECLLGLSSYYLQKRFKIIPFDEAFGFETSRNLVYSQLFLSGKKSGNHWIFNLNYPGKNKLIDSYSGLYFDQPITIGKAYILKLIHLVEEKIHARSTGSYSLVTQQPLKGKSKKGGQRVGEMEVWAIEGYGAAYTLHEILTIKSDDIKNRQKIINSILNNTSMTFGTTETFKVLTRELQSLCLNLQFFK